MNYFDLLFSRKGTIKPQPFALIVTSVYVLNLIAGSMIDGKFVERASVWPYVFLQATLTWVWFTAHSKRLRDAGRDDVVAMVIATIYFLCVSLLVYFTASALAEPSAIDGEPRSTLIGTIVAVLLIYTLASGDIFLIAALILAWLILPLLFSLAVVVYSIMTGARPSLLVAEAQPERQRPAS